MAGCQASKASWGVALPVSSDGQQEALGAVCAPALRCPRSADGLSVDSRHGLVTSL